MYLLFCLLFYDLGTFSRQAYSAISISRMCSATQRPRRSSSLIEFRKWHVPVWNVLGGEGVCQELRHLQEEDVGFHSRVHVIHSGDSTLLGSHHLYTPVVSTSPAESQQVKICVHCSTTLASSYLTRLCLVPGTATRATLKIYFLRADRKACRWPSEVVAEPMPIRYDFVSIRAHPASAGKRSVCASSASSYCDEHLSKTDETITCEQATYER